MGQKSEAVNVGCKVLPICDVATLGSMTSGDVGKGVEKEVQKRRKAVSRMKELVKWAAAAKNAKGGIKAWKVLYFKSKMGLKDSLDDASSNSSKISFRWDVGSCSTSSAVLSPFSMPLASRSDSWTKNLPSSSTTTLQSSSSNVSILDTPNSEECSRGGQWITTDSDFVVLEL